MSDKPVKPRTLAFSFSLAILILAWISLASFWSTHQLVSSFGDVTQAHQTLENLQHIDLLMQTAESSVRGFVITGQESRLGPYRYAKLDVPYELKRMSEQFAAYPRQQKTFARLSRLLNDQLNYLTQTVHWRRAQGYAAAAQWILTEDDSSKRDAMEHLMSQIQQQERVQLRQRWTDTSESSLKTKAVLVFATMVSAGLLAWVFGLLRRESEERHQAENVTQRTETFLHSIIERIPYMIMVKECQNLRLTVVNKAAEQWLGRTRQELMGSNELDLRPKEEAMEAMQKDREVIQEGKGVNIPEDALLVAGKEQRVLHTQKIPVPDEEGNPAFLLTISEDITQRLQAEKMMEMSRDAAVESARLKAEFIRNMSHEIRTPLSIVVGMTTLLLDTELSTDQRRFASTVQRAAEGLTQLSKSLLDFSKIEAGSFVLESRELHIQQIVEDTVGMLREQAKAKGFGLVNLISNDVPSVLQGDSSRLRQVLTQLIGNAVKFTARGEVIIRVTTQRQTDNQVWLTFRISDTGIGIPQEAQKHLFEPFRQGDGSRTRRFGGTGLGLTISKRIVELMGGEIGFESVENQGSTFWCNVPFNKPHVHGPVVRLPSLPWTKSRVLIIDESETFRELTQQQLTSWSLVSEGVPDGQAALELLIREDRAGRPFAIVLMDMHLMDMDAVAFMRALKSKPTLEKTKVLVMVGRGSSLDPETALSLGFVGSIPKPPRATELYDRLVSLINEPTNPSHQRAA